MTKQEKAVEGIRDAAKRRGEANAAKVTATSDLRRWCKLAKEAGIPISRIASEADLSRQGVYDLLEERPSP